LDPDPARADAGLGAATDARGDKRTDTGPGASGDASDAAAPLRDAAGTMPAVIPDAAAPVLRVTGLHAAYGATDVLHGVDLQALPHEIVAVLGPNGAGKSTLLRALCGLADVSVGAVILHGEDVTGQPAADLAHRGVGYVPQRDNVFPSLTVAETLDLGRVAARSGTDTHATMERTLDLFPVLREKGKVRARALPRGERQMLALARALVAGPSLLLLDEPSAGLAPEHVAAILAAVQRVAEAGVPILLVEQNAHRALAIAHRAYVLDRGRNAFSGTAAELAASAAVARLYLGRSTLAPARSEPADDPAATPLEFHVVGEEE
jgi:branched-chain amino acid transport system ATP-binding protein